MGVKRSGSKKKQDYYGTGGSRINRSRHQTIDDNDQDDHHDNHGDEVQLTSFPGWPLHFLRGKDSSDHMASNSNIQVKEEIVISWN